MKGNIYNKIILAEKQEAWLIKHFKHTKNADVSKKLGVSLRTVNRMAKSLGLTKSPQFIRKCQADAAAAANMSNRLNGTYPPKGYKIPRCEEFWFKKREKPIDRIGARKEKARIAKCVESRKKTFKLEKARALYDLPRQTKLKVVQRPRKQIWMRYYLKQKGYIIERGNNVAYYNSETQRSRKLEEKPMTGFTFLEQITTSES